MREENLALGHQNVKIATQFRMMADQAIAFAYEMRNDGCMLTFIVLFTAFFKSHGASVITWSCETDDTSSFSQRP